MQFFTKEDLSGIQTAGGGSARRPRVDPFAAIEGRRIAYAGRARSQTALGQIRLPRFGLTPPELTVTPEGKLEFQMPELRPTGQTIEIPFPGTREPTPLPSLPAEAFPEEYGPAPEGTVWGEEPAPEEVVMPSVVEPTVPAPANAVARAGFTTEKFGQNIIATVRAYPKEALAIASIGFFIGSIIKKLLGKGIE